MCKSPDSSSAEDLTDHRDYMPHIICQAFLSTVVRVTSHKLVSVAGPHAAGHDILKVSAKIGTRS